MKYLLILTVLLCLALKGFCGKKTSQAVALIGDAFRFNFTRMLFCLIIATVPMLIEKASFAIEWRMAAICLFSGAVNVGLVVFWIFGVRKIALVTLDAAQTLSSILPAVLCLVLFGTPIKWSSLLGFAMIFGAACLLASYSRQQKGGFSLGAFALMVLTGICDGMMSFSQQLYRRYYTADGEAVGDVIYSNVVFQFYTFLFATVIFAVILICWRLWGKEKPSAESTARFKKAVPLIVIMAGCLFAASYLQTFITSTLGVNPDYLYPVIKGGCLVMSNGMGTLFFGEKITVKSVVGSLIIIASIAVMSLL